MHSKRLDDFMLRVAMPREFAINFIVNGGIAAFLFWNRSEVPLTGLDGLSAMLMPMSFLLPWLTSFFGVASYAWTPSVHVEDANQGDGPSSTKPWQWGRLALRLAFLHAFAVMVAMYLILRAFSIVGSTPVLSGATSVLGIALGSGLVACILHRRSILKANQSMNQEANRMSH